MMDILLQPFQFPFMQSAFGIGLVIAFPTAFLSCFMVLKGWALMGDAVSHATLPGIVLAWILGIPLVAGAFGAGLGSAMAMGYLSKNCRVKHDTIMGIVFSGMFGAGIVMYTQISTNVHLTHVLFGNMLGVGARDLWTSGVIAAIVAVTLLLKWRDFLLHAFDPAQARACGLNTTLLHYILIICLSLTIVATLTSIGLILAVALIVTPGAIGFLVVRSFGKMLVVALAASLFALLAGAYASFFLDSGPAPTVVLILTGLFIIAFGYRLRVTHRYYRQYVTQQRDTPKDCTVPGAN